MRHAWIWPVRRVTEETWNVRLGRVLHWVSVGLSVVVLVLALIFMLHGYASASDSRDAIAKWDWLHPSADVKKLPTKQLLDIVANPDPNEARPIEIKADDTALIFGAPTAFLILLAGRGFRYILGGE